MQIMHNRTGRGSKVSRSILISVLAAAFIVSGFFVPNASAVVAGLTVISPNGGEVWNATPHNITWTSISGDPGDLVDIAIIKTLPTETSDTVAHDVPFEAGTFTWTPPPFLSDSTSYVIRIYAAGTSTVYDTSNAVFTIDKTAPSIIAPPNVTKEATGPLTPADLGLPTVLDNLDPSPDVTNNAPANFQVGITTVTWTATDWAGNSATATQTVTITDTTKPIIAFHENLTAFASTSAGIAVTYTPPDATDLVDGIFPATCLPVSGSTFPLGVNTVDCNATDSHGNSADPTSFTVTVVDNVAPSVTEFALNGLAADAFFNPNNANVQLSITANESVKFNRIYICTLSDATCGDGTAVKWFTTDTFSTSDVETWNGRIHSTPTIAPDGVYKVKIKMKDESNNETIVEELAFHITIDTVSPTITDFTAPVADAVYKTAPPLKFTPDDSTTEVTCSYKIDGGSATPVPCSKGVPVNTTIGSLADGRHSVVVAVADAAGNTILSSAVSFVFDNDNTLRVPSDFTTIQAAVNAATSGDAIVVAIGTYSENVVVNKTLNLRGANAGVDARNLRGAESIVDGGGISAAFQVTANNVTLDGFTIKGGQNGLNAGVWSQATNTGLSIVNNVVTDNAIGLFPQCGDSCLIQFNLFDSNNRVGAAGGSGIYVENTNGLSVVDNKFINHTENNPVIFAATGPASHTNLVFSRNSLNNSFGIYVLAVSHGVFEANTISTDEATGVSFGGGNSDISVLGNQLTNNARGLRVTDDGFGLGTNNLIEVHLNSFVGNTNFGAGVLSGYVGSLNAERNWWNSATGPTHTSNPGGSGDAVTANVDYSPWCMNPECTEFGSNDALAQLLLSFVPDTVVLPGSSELTITAVDATGAKLVNDSSTQIELGGGGNMSFDGIAGNALRTLGNGEVVIDVSNSVAETVNVIGYVAGVPRGNGQVEFTNAAPTGIVLDDIIPLHTIARPTNLYLEGWHYRFRITVNNTAETKLHVKFEDWTDTAGNHVVVAGNTRMLINEAGGTDVGLDETNIETGIPPNLKSYSLGNTYEAQGPSAANISDSAIDENPDRLGKQIHFDVFTRLPIGTVTGSYGTTFGICTLTPSETVENCPD